jgi:hypothetical protein
MRFSYKNALEKLKEYALKQGFEEVILEHSGGFIEYEDTNMYSPLKLYVPSGYTNDTRVYIMLHELGHHELRKNWGKFETRLPAVARAEKAVVRKHKNGKKYKRRDSFHISSLEEEFLAWDEGLKLGLKLGIKINMDKWMKVKASMLKTYIKYYGTMNKKPTE